MQQCLVCWGLVVGPIILLVTSAKPTLMVRRLAALVLVCALASRAFCTYSWRDTCTVGTHNWPVDFRYISNRLVTEIVRQSEAMRRRWKPSLSLSLKIGWIGLTKLDLDYQNKYLLCRAATEAVRDQTGTLADPGEYVRAELNIQMGYLTVYRGWRDLTHVKIAALLTVVPVDDLGSVLVALFGRAFNYTWMRPPDNDRGEIPSDVDGLYGLLNATREPSDPQIEEHFLERDPGHNDHSRADLIVRLLHDRYEGFVERRLDVLAKVFHSVDDYSYGGSHYERVIIGSPVWAATPLPKALLPSRAQ